MCSPFSFLKEESEMDTPCRMHNKTERNKGMRITFDSTPYQNTDSITTYQPTSNRTPVVSHALDISDNKNYAAYGHYQSKGLSAGAAEVMQAAGASDVSLYRDYMTVMSNTMSDEDFAKLKEEGYHPMDMDLEDAANIVDVIKTELMKSGVNVTGYTDTVDSKVLESITGSVTYANQLLDSFAREDIPLTEKNVSQAVLAVSRGQELTEMSEGAVKYMVNNELAPTIDNLYLAEHAGAEDAGKQAFGYFMEDMPGYFAQKANLADVENLQTQVDKVIEKAGYPVDEDTRKMGMWLVEKGIPLTTDNLERLHDLDSLTLPAETEHLCQAVAAAIAEGKSAGSADLRIEKSIYRRAVDFYEAHRSMEEIRLHMTVEANLKLLKSGFSIDTAPIEETIEALKALEANQTGTANVPGATTDVPGTTTDVLARTTKTPVSLCREVMEKTARIPYLPAVTPGRILRDGAVLSTQNLFEVGSRIAEEFQKANEAYETMFTEVRGDLGDSIKKAFRNVDALLTDMGVELNEENRKAARSLSYNQMEFNEENLLKVKHADKIVRRVVEKMTPSSVLNMIRDGVNPLEASMEELEAYFEAQDNYAEDSEKYSRFLYRLEQSKQISAEEKESFIGIYRLLNQLDKSDGAALGKLVHVGAEVNFKNLLSAIRTGRVRGIDLSVNDAFGGLEEAVAKGVSIDVQIDSAYNHAKLQEIRSLSEAEVFGESKKFSDLPTILKNLEEPVTLNNLLALKGLKESGIAPYKKIQELDEERGESLLEEGLFGEAFPGELFSDKVVRDVGISETVTTQDIFTDRAHFQEAFSALNGQAESLVREMTFAETRESMDIRVLQISCKQLHLQRKMSLADEEYDIPYLLDGEVTALHLKLVHDEGEKGSFFVEFASESFGSLSGNFSIQKNTVSGLFACEKRENRHILAYAGKVFETGLTRAGFEVGSIQITEGSMTGLTRKNSEKIETARLYQAAGIALTALKEGLKVAEREVAYEN